jgi:hypothetical protein
MDTVAVSLALAQLMPLGVTFLQERERRGERTDASAFREWLEAEAFPQLLTQAEQTFATLVSLKASEHEHYASLELQMREIRAVLEAAIDEHLEPIRKAVAQPSASDRWSQLRDIERATLSVLFERCTDDPTPSVGKDDIARLDAASTPADARKSMRFLHERQLVKLSEYTQAWSARATWAGLVLAWQAIDGHEYQRVKTALGRSLPDGDDCVTVGALAATAETSIGRAYAILGEWANRSVLDLQGAFPYSRARVSAVSEAFRRGMK